MSDLVIGARRAGPPKPWRAGVIAVAMVAVALIVAWFIYRRSVAYDMPGGECEGVISRQQAAPGAPPALVFGSSSLSWTGGIPVLRVTGDAHAIGAAHGRLLGHLLDPMWPAVRPSIERTVDDSGWFADSTHNMRLAWRWRFVDDGLVDSDRRMVAGAARGAAASGVDLDYDDLVRTQAILDVGLPSLTSGEAELHTLSQSLTALAHQQAQPQRVWLARSFGLAGLDDGGESAIPVVTLAHPEGRIAWASVGWPGQLGVVTGINARGIALALHPTRTVDVRETRTARPIAHLARAVLEQASTLDEAVKLLEVTPTLGAAVFVLADGSGQWLLVERTPSKAIVERAPKLAAIGDVLTTHALTNEPHNDRARRMLPTLPRSDRAAKLVRQPLADVAAVASVLRDRRAPDDSQRAYGHRGTLDDGRASHLAIIDPATLELWVADPTARGRLRAFDLRFELRREGTNPSPPPDIGEDPAIDATATAQLVLARRELRAARAALVAGDVARAGEAVARARTHAPDLPEAIELDAFVAQAAGDTARAREMFQRWVDGGADDPRGEERAHALIDR